jgi:hypothetical protein
VKLPRRFRKVHYVSSANKITSYAGLKLLTDLADKLDILTGLRRCTIKKRRRGIPVTDFLMSFVHNFLVGGSCLSDLRVLRSEQATRSHLYNLEVPAPTTAGEFLRKFTTGHIKQLERVIGTAILRCARLMGGEQPITLDLDSSIFQIYGYLKEGARYTYTSVKGYHPLLCFWAETRLLVGVRLRSGNKTSAQGATSFLGECLARVPTDHRRLRLRLDAGFYCRNVVTYLVKKTLDFSISALLTSALRRAIEAIPNENWQPYPWEEEAEWTEFSYQPQRWPKAFRLIVKRTPLYQGRQRLIGEFFYVPIITNRRGAGSSILKHHLARGGAENYIEEFKNGLGARHLPSQRFNANWAWLVTAQLAYNLAQAFKLLVLPRQEHPVQLKSLRLHWLCVAGRLIRSGRRYVLALARGPDDVLRFTQAQARILAL